jgi:hypothetical protein
MSEQSDGSGGKVNAKAPKPSVDQPYQGIDTLTRSSTSGHQISGHLPPGELPAVPPPVAVGVQPTKDTPPYRLGKPKE